MRRFLLLAALMLLAGVVAWWGMRATQGPPPAPSAPEVIAPAPPAPRQVAVYFAREMPDGRFVLTPVQRPLANPAAPATAALQALVDGPTSAEERDGLLPTLPGGTRVLGVRVEQSEGDGSVAIANLSRELAENFNGGSGWEEIVLYSIANTLDALAGVDAVRLQVEGAPVESIGGHMAANELLRYNDRIVVRGQDR
ncbi:MAG: GerMN domain-containing protein [Armatimonadetes bacterium]|nr:GerMN domain-containing protein [Armatimonadota bacterium]